MASKTSVMSFNTDYREIKTEFPWDLNNWRITRERKAKITFDDVSLAQHSCKFDFSLWLNDGVDQCEENYSLLQISVHDVNKLGSLISISVDINCKGRRSRWEPKFVDLKYTETGTITFELPPVINLDDREDELEKFVEDNVLRIYFCIEEYIQIRRIENEFVQSDQKFVLQLDAFKEFYKTQAFIDVTFIIGLKKQRLHAHAVVLVAACPYFSSMLNGSNMKEQKSRVVDLSADTDVSVKIFKGFLDYVYGIKKVEEMSSIITGLSILADKYNFSQLRQACDRVLCDSLNKDNVTSLLFFAYRYNLELLKARSLNLAMNCNVDLGTIFNFTGCLKNPESLSKLT